jgi:hypothetical protein
MKRSHLKLEVLTGGILGALLCAQHTTAQVVPDKTLPVGERSHSPLLTISVPIGLHFNSQQGDIVVQGTPDNPFNEVGDAGQLLDTAQTVGTSFNVINATLDNANDVDLYRLYLRQGVAQSKSGRIHRL